MQNKASLTQASVDVIKDSFSDPHHHVWIDTGKRNEDGKKIFKSARTRELKAFPEEEIDENI